MDLKKTDKQEQQPCQQVCNQFKTEENWSLLCSQVYSNGFKFNTQLTKSKINTTRLPDTQAVHNTEEIITENIQLQNLYTKKVLLLLRCSQAV